MTIDEPIKILTWKDVRESIIAQNPMIGEEIDNIKGVSKYEVIRARYPYGADIVKSGRFYLYQDGKSVDYERGNVAPEIRALLNYSWKTIPFGIVNHSSVESFIDHSSHVVPFRLLKPGKTFSLLTIFEKEEFTHYIPHIYSTKSGCRSLLMLPKLTHTLSNERIKKKFHLHKHLKPKTLAEQWFLFYEMTSSVEFNSKWNAELIYFSHEFVHKIDKTLAFRYKLLYHAWDQVAFRRNHPTHDFIWSLFYQNLKLSLKNDPFIIETVRHIIKLAMQQVPGYVPTTSDMAGPISDFTDVFLNIYKIRFNLPIFMRLDHYDHKTPIYYSLQRHTFICDLPVQSNARMTVNELQNIRSVLLSFVDYILNDRFEHSLKCTVLYRTLKQTRFDFYHPKGGPGINSNITELLKDDPRFLKIPYKGTKHPDLQFPLHSIFFNGCIRIKPV